MAALQPLVEEYTAAMQYNTTLFDLRLPKSSVPGSKKDRASDLQSLLEANNIEKGKQRASVVRFAHVKRKDPPTLTPQLNIAAIQQVRERMIY